MSPQRRTFRLALVLAMLVSAAGSAAADEFKVVNEPARDPVRLDFGVELTVPDRGLGGTVGVHTWLGDRLRIGGSFGIWRARFEADLDGNGFDDYSSQQRGPWRYSEFAADVAYSLEHSVDRVSFGRGYRKVVTDENGVTRTPWAKTTTIERARDVSLSVGARAAVGGDAFQLGIPVGLRVGSRTRTRREHFRAGWIQARAIVIPQSPTVGFEAEAMYRRAVYGVSLHGQYVPLIGPADPAGIDCLAPRVCSPAAPISSLNRVPDDAMWLVSLRFHLVLAL